MGAAYVLVPLLGFLRARGVIWWDVWTLRGLGAILLSFVKSNRIKKKRVPCSRGPWKAIYASVAETNLEGCCIPLSLSLSLCLHSL